MLLVTYGCNLHCVYCYEPKQVQKQMSFDMAKKSLLRQIQALDNDTQSLMSSLWAVSR